MSDNMPPMALLMEVILGGKKALTPMDLITKMMKGENCEFVRSKETKQIILPESMSLVEAKKWIIRRMEEEEREVEIHEEVDAFPFDAAYALHKALGKIYGWTDMIPTPGFFGSDPPRMVGVEVDIDKTVQVGWGRIQIPNVEGYIETRFTFKDGARPILLVGGVVKQKHKKEISDLVALTRKLVEKESIYRGRATLIDFNYNPDDFDPTRCPTFMRLGGVRKEELIFPEKVQREIDTSLFAPILHSRLLREMQVPLKRGVLMFGDFGVGKTLCAHIAAKMCEENGWTFVYLRDATQLPAAIDFAHQYQPCMIFSEDIDQVLSGKGKRAKEMNDILNVIDGIDSKGSEIMVVLTTNHIEEIHQAALRPGRLDAVIHITAPDAKSVEKLIRNYSRGRLADDESLSEIGKVLEGQIPALIREVVERSKISAAMRCTENSGGETVHASDVKIVASDLLVAAESLTNQIELLKPKSIDKRIELEKFGDAVGSQIGDRLAKILSGSRNGKDN